MDCSTPGSPSFAIPRSLLQFMSIESVMLSHHLILCWLLLLLPSIFSSIRVFFSESTLHIRWPKYWSFSFSISLSSEYSGLISFRIDWFDLLAVQGTIKSLLQYQCSKASNFWCSGFFIVQLSVITNYIILVKYNNITIQYTVKRSSQYLATIHHHTEYNLFFLWGHLLWFSLLATFKYTMQCY